jgi:hypothetical protein
MAKAKNVFIKSKMNKDLDDRLVPPGEYRDGQNIQISRSEGADVGALENVLGNLLLTDFNIPVQCCNVEVIGKYMDVTNDRIIVFLTNFIDNSVNGLDNKYVFGTTANNAYYSSICVYNIKSNTSQLLVGGDGLKGQFLNFAKNHPIYHINLIENLLFWTDNRNQPRKINIEAASANSLYYTTEDNISVAKYYPYKSMLLMKDNISTMLDVINQKLPDNTTDNPYYDQFWQGDPNFIKDKFLRFSYRFKFEDGENSLMAPFTQPAFIPKQDGYFISEMDDALPTQVGKSDEDITFQSTEVRFFENKVNKITLLIESPDGVAFSELYNKLKVTGIDILYKESDGLSCKVVETIPREVFEFLTPAANGVLNTTNIMEYVYNSSKPYKTLPQDDTTRVFDKVPVRASTQEVSGNRVIYGNFINKHTPPRSIDYNVLVSEKEDSGLYLPQFNINNKVEYPNHTLKQNRTYQVGIVLSDRYGRQSSVLLSSSDSGQTIANPYYSGSTVFNKYNEDSIINPGNNYSWPGDALRVLFNNVLVPNNDYDYATGEPGIYNENTNPLGWYSYKIVVKQQEQDYYNIYFPGVLNGGVQNEIGDPATPNQPFAHITLQGDNINKVPRDLKNVGPDQKVFRTSRPTKVENPMWYSVANKEGDAVEATFTDWNSLEARNFILQRNIDLGLTEPDTGSNASLKLYLRVDNDGVTHTGHENKQFHPGTSADTTVNVGTGIDLGLWNSGSFPVYIYNPQSNPLCARLEVNDFNVGLPADAAGAVPQKKPILAIYETEPEISRLRLFWETSTSGLVADLNSAIEEASDTIIDPNDPTGGTWDENYKLFAENQCPWDAYAQSYAYNKRRCQVSSIFSFSNTGGSIMGQGTGGANIQLLSAERMNLNNGWDDVLVDFGVQMWWPGYNGTGSVPAGVDPYQAFLFIKDTFWFSFRNWWNKYRFSFLITDTTGSYIVNNLESNTSNIEPFAGWVPTSDDFKRYDGAFYNGGLGTSLSIGPSGGYVGDPSLNKTPINGGSYQDPKRVNLIGNKGPSYNYPRNWIEDGYPRNITGINQNITVNSRIMDTALEQYIELGLVNWIRLPIGNGSWFDGRNSADIAQWTADNYGSGNKDNAGELNVEIISQTIVRPVIPGDYSNLQEYTSVNGRPINEFSISDYRDINNVNSPYAVLESDFSNTLAADYVDGEIFKITIRYTDCWRDKGGGIGGTFFDPSVFEEDINLEIEVK